MATVPPPVLHALGPPFTSFAWRAVGGGFSGAAVFAGRPAPNDPPAVALKAWPSGTSRTQLQEIHAAMRAARERLPIVPQVVVGPIVVDQTVWDVTEWRPGEPDLTAHLAPERLVAVGRFLAHLHAAWLPTVPRVLPFPAVRRRLRVLADWRSRCPEPPLHPDATLTARLRTAHERLVRSAAAAEARLHPWQVPVAVQFCWCDGHPAHFLFEPGTPRLSGVVDFGGLKVDHPAVDLARFLIDSPHADDGPILFDAYAAAGGPSPDAELVGVLVDTGRLGALANWLLRIADGECPDASAVAGRLGKLLHE